MGHHLEQCVLTKSERFPAQWKVVLCNPDTWSTLENIPGVVYHSGSKLGDAGWYVPHSLVDRQHLPATLDECGIESDLSLPNGGKLRDYQARAVNFLRLVTPDREGCILAASMGLGKSNSALTALHRDGYLSRRGVVLGPAISESTWCAEGSDAQKFFGLKIIPLRGMKAPDFSVLVDGVTDNSWFFCHYGILHAWFVWLSMVLKPSSLIFDESHHITHAKAGCSHAARNLSLSASVERRYLLTGTPIPNKRIELWHQLAIAQPRQWGKSSFSFGMRYCDPENDGNHWKFDGASRDEELRARLRGVLLRYTPLHPLVASQLPRLSRHLVHIESLDPEFKEAYDKARGDIMTYLREVGLRADKKAEVKSANRTIELSKNAQAGGGETKLLMFTHLINILSEAKAEKSIAILREVLQTHHRVLVFTWRRKAAKSICDALRAEGITCFGPVDGNMKRAQRVELAQEFSTIKGACYVATRKAAGETLNDLVCADVCVMVDLYWNTTSLMQAESRIYRDGSWFDAIDVYYMIASDTIDEYMMAMLEEKSHAPERVSDDTSSLDLVLDLSPNRQAGGIDLDAFCEALMKD